MAQSIKCSTLDFPSGRDLRVLRQSPASALCSAGSLLEILTLPLPLPLPLLARACTFSLKINNFLKKILFIYLREREKERA